MGDIADGLINGDFDEETGEYLGEGQGFPRSLSRQARQNKNSVPPGLGSIQKVLTDNGYVITVIKQIDYGIQMRTASGAIVNVYTSGKVCLQGKADKKLQDLIK